MTPRRLRALAALVTLGGLAPIAARAQTLAQRVARAPEGRVQFSFATRDGVCGDGRSYIHLSSASSNQVYGSFDDVSSEPCMRGPARVVLDRAEHQVVGLRVFVGPPSNDGAADLGTVSAGDASAYLLQLADTAQGAVSRDAILPAMLADSVDNQRALVVLARDRTRSRETRRSAIAWLGRVAGADRSLPATLVSIAADDEDNPSVRQQALSTLARLPGGGGMASLITLADDAQGGWVARTALSVISSSGDPRARDYLRGVVRKAALPDEALAVAIRSFGQEYATAADISTIRDAWPKLVGDRAQDAALSAVARFGGPENVRWLLSMAQDMGTTSSVRRRALDGAAQAGAHTADLVSLYDGTTDPQLKDAAIAALSQIGDRAATDKLIAIARNDDSAAARRRAVAVLGRSSDPRAKAALEALVERRP